MNTQFMEGYRIGLAEMREKCAKVMESGVLGHGECAAAIRAINFEGDTGFRPVSEMIAEHKQDPKKAAAIEKAKMRKAEQEPVAILKPWSYGGSTGVNDYLMSDGSIRALTPDEARAINAAPQPVSQEYQDHLVNQSFDWAAMAAKHQFMEGYRIGLAEMREKCAKVCEEKRIQMNYSEAPYNQCAAAIRAIKFEGDIGFRPVSEMIAEHKQDPKKAAAIEKAKMRKAGQEPVAWRVRGYNQFKTGNPAPWRYVDGVDKPSVNKPDCCDFEPLYAAPVRTKDLTDDEIHKAFYSKNTGLINWIRAVIAADREKNK